MSRTGSPQCLFFESPLGYMTQPILYKGGPVKRKPDVVVYFANFLVRVDMLVVVSLPVCHLRASVI